MDTISKGETNREAMKRKIRNTVSKAVATVKTVKTEFWDRDNEPPSPRIATAAAAALAPRWEDDRWSTEVKDLHSKLSHVKEGLETALARVSYLEQSIFDKETSLEIEPDDRLMDADTLERGKRRHEALAARAKELWGDEDVGRRVIEAVNVKVKAKEGVEGEVEEEEEEERKGAAEGEQGRHVEGVSLGRNNAEKSRSAQQLARPRTTRRGTRAGAAVKRRTRASNARDGGGERGLGGAVVGEEAGGNRKEIGATCVRAGPGSLTVLLKKLCHPVIMLFLVCFGVFVWQLAQP